MVVIVVMLYVLMFSRPVVIVAEVADVLSSDFVLLCSCFNTVMFLLLLETLSLSPAWGLQI